MSSGALGGGPEKELCGWVGFFTILLSSQCARYIYSPGYTFLHQVPSSAPSPTGLSGLEDELVVGLSDWTIPLKGTISGETIKYSQDVYPMALNGPAIVLGRHSCSSGFQLVLPMKTVIHITLNQEHFTSEEWCIVSLAETMSADDNHTMHSYYRTSSFFMEALRRMSKAEKSADVILIYDKPNSDHVRGYLTAGCRRQFVERSSQSQHVCINSYMLSSLRGHPTSYQFRL